MKVTRKRSYEIHKAFSNQHINQKWKGTSYVGHSTHLDKIVVKIDDELNRPRPKFPDKFMGLPIMYEQGKMGYTLSKTGENFV